MPGTALVARAEPARRARPAKRTKTTDVIWRATPRLPRRACSHAQSGLRSWLHPRRMGVVNVLGACAALGLMERPVLEAAPARDDASEMHALTVAGLTALARWMDAEFARGLGRCGGDFGPLAHIDLDPRGDGGTDLVFIGYGSLETRVPMERLPREIARALYAALTLCAHEAEAMLPEDLMHFSYWIEARLDDVRALRDRGLLDDMAAAWAYAERHCETLSGYALDGFREIVAQTREWLDGPPDWQDTRSLLGRSRRPAEAASRLLRVVWGWRRSARDLYRHPMTRVIRGMSACARRYHRDVARHGSITVGPPDEGETHLALLNVVRLGVAWEDPVADGIQEEMMQAGETALLRLKLDRLAYRALVARLRVMARAQGLIARAGEIAREEMSRD